MGILSAVKRGASAVQGAYNKQKAAAEERGRRRIENAKTRLAKERAKADLELERQKLRRELYEAQTRVQAAKKATARARKEAGGDWLDKAGKFATSASKSIMKLGVPPPRKKRGKSRRVTTSSKQTGRRRGY